MSFSLLVLQLSPHLRVKLWAFRNCLHAASDVDKHAPCLLPTSQLLHNLSMDTIN